MARKHNPERRAWRGRSYRKGGERIRDLKERSEKIRLRLPFLGTRTVSQDPKEPGHWLWLSDFGWHDCMPAEDILCEAFHARVTRLPG